MPLDVNKRQKRSYSNLKVSVSWTIHAGNLGKQARRADDIGG